MMMMMIVQRITSFFDFSCCILGRGIDWAVEDVAWLRGWLHEGWKPRNV